MSARVLIDGHNLTLRNSTGIGTYARNLAATISGIGLKPELLLGGNASVDQKDPQFSEIALFDALTALKPSQKVRVQRLVAAAIGRPLGVRATPFSRVGAVFDPSAASLDGFDKLHVAASLFEFGASHFRRFGSRLDVKLRDRPDLFHLTFPAPLKTRGCPNVYTIHDIVPLRLPQTTLDDKKLFLRLIRNLCREADQIVTVSEFSKQDLMRFFGLPEDRITNTYQSVFIPPAIADKSDDTAADEIAKAFGLDYRGYYLFYGAIEPKKNLARLIDAYVASGSAVPLIVVGGLGWQYAGDIKKLKDERFLYYRRDADRIVPSRRVRRFPYLPLSQLMTLVKGARGVIFPSLYEGFGLPVLEAMALGTPVITSNVASLPEISGDAAVLINPTDVDDIAQAIIAFDYDEGLRQELALRGKRRAAYFSPEAYRERVGALYRKLGVESSRLN
jgi:glycosyltransferase involved in cell wall biosynthesis